MKRIAVSALLIILFTVLCSCSGETDGKANSNNSQSTSNSEKTSQSTTVNQQKIEHIAESVKKGRVSSFDDYNEQEKEQIKKAVEADGYTLEFNPDGSGTLSNDEGKWFVAKGWVDNEFTQGIPAPEFGEITMSAQDEDDNGAFYIFLIRGANAMQVAEYVSALEDIGFTKDKNSQIDVDAGVVMFDASNGDGKSVAVGFSTNGFTLRIYNNK